MCCTLLTGATGSQLRKTFYVDSFLHGSHSVSDSCVGRFILKSHTHEIISFLWYVVRETSFTLKEKEVLLEKIYMLIDYFIAV